MRRERYIASIHRVQGKNCTAPRSPSRGRKVNLKSTFTRKEKLRREREPSRIARALCKMNASERVLFNFGVFSDRERSRATCTFSIKHRWPFSIERPSAGRKSVEWIAFTRRLQTRTRISVSNRSQLSMANPHSAVAIIRSSDEIFLAIYSLHFILSFPSRGRIEIYRVCREIV